MRALVPILLSLVVVLTGCTVGSKVKYKVTYSPNGLDITYFNKGGNIEQKDISSGQWSTSFSAPTGQFVSILAQVGSENANITELRFTLMARWKNRPTAKVTM